MWEFQFGVYHYSYVNSIDRAILEAKNCLNFIKGKKIDLPVFYDLEEIDGKMNITCAGMPKSCYSQVEWEKFKTGFTCGGKLTFKHVKGRCKIS